MNKLIKNIIREETNQNELFLQGIGIAISILKKDYPFIIDWEIKNEWTSFTEIDLICDINKTSEFYDSPIIPGSLSGGDMSVPYPHWLLDIRTKLNEDENFALYRGIRNDLNEIYDEIPGEFKRLFGTSKSIYLDLTIDRFKFVNSENLEESKRVNLKEKYKISKNEFVELYRDNDFTLTIPLTHEASKKYGSDTKWCTTTKECSKKFEDHINLGVLGYITIRDKELKNKLENNAFALYRLYGDDVNRTIVFDDQNNEYKNGEQWLSNKFDRVDKLFQFYKMFRNFNEYFEKQNVKKQVNESEDRPNEKLLNALIYDLILPQYEHIICDIEYKEGKEDYPSVTVTFIGGKKTRMWPITQGIRKMYNEVLDEIWNTIYDYTGVAVGIYSKYVEKCEKENINESTEDSNYIEIIQELVEPFRNEDGVCDINVYYGDEDHMYYVYLVFGTEELNDKFFYVDEIRRYRNKLTTKIKTEIESYLPIKNIIVGSYGNPNCGWKPLNESEKKPSYLDIIEDLAQSYKDRDFVCDVEVLYDEEDDFYVVTLWFDPNEMGKRADFYVKNLRKELTAEIKTYLPIDNVYVGSGGNVGCSKKNINEPITEGKIPSSDYNSLEKIMNVVMSEKFDWWKDIKINNIDNDHRVNYTKIDAEITVDEDWGGNQWNQYHPHMEFPGNKGWGDNDEYELVSLGDIVGSKLADDIRETISETLKYTLGIETNVMSFRNLMLIFE